MNRKKVKISATLGWLASRIRSSTSEQSLARQIDYKIRLRVYNQVEDGMIDPIERVERRIKNAIRQQLEEDIGE